MTQADQGAGRAGAGVNAGYQRDDRDIVDYELWTVGDQQARGPPPPDDRPFGVVLGAAQVFGRFVPRPFPARLAAALDLPMLNLGFSGSGPSFFLQRPALIDMANRARFAVVHLMSGRSVSNSRVIVDRNQGQALLRDRPDQRPMFAEDVYRTLLRTLPAADLARLRAETRAAYVDETRALLERIAVPKVLLYWAQRPVAYAETLRGIAGYWGDFPHFVNREVIDLLRPHADLYVEVVGDRGLPQPLRSRATGRPVEIWPADRFPNVRLRDHNHYYPSPEMNDDAARALLPACRTLLAGVPARSRAPARTARQLLAHVDIFGNASGAIVRSLRESFGARFLDPPADGRTGDDVARDVAADPAALAVSSARWRFDPERRFAADVHPIVFLRHPLLRARALYRFERGEARQRDSTAVHTRMAGRSTLAEWIDWCLSDPPRAGPIADYQTRVCGRAMDGARQEEDWTRPVTLARFEEARRHLARAHVGTVEDLSGSMTRIEGALRSRFPTLRLLAYDAADFQASADDIRAATEKLCEDIGEPLFARLAAANAHDLLLHHQACAGAVGQTLER